MRSVTEPAPQNSITSCQTEQKCNYCNDTNSILWAAWLQGRTPRLAMQLWGHHSTMQSHQDIILNLSAFNPCGFCYKNETIKGWKAWKACCSPEGWEQETGSVQCWKSAEEIWNLEISDPTTTHPTLYLRSTFSINSNTSKTLPLTCKFFNSENVKATRQMFESFLQP